MSLSSMTGFARHSGQSGAYRWTVEIKSVNGKALDVKTRLPHELDGQEAALKSLVRKRLSRGSVFLMLSLEGGEDKESFVLHEERLKTLIEMARTAAYEGVEPARVDGLMSIRGVVELKTLPLDEEELKALEGSVLEGVGAALDSLVSARAGEGARVEAVLRDQLNEIARLVGEADTLAGDRIVAMQARYKSQLDKMMGGDSPVPEERLAQEIALLAVKADIREEIDRLRAHISDAVDMMGSAEPVGRRLDFLCQELNREANTLCSKSGDHALTKVGLAMKVVIEQFREQVQNIE